MSDLIRRLRAARQEQMLREIAQTMARENEFALNHVR